MEGHLKVITGDDLLRAAQRNDAVIQEHDGDGTVLGADLGVELQSVALHAYAYAENHDDVPVAFMTGCLAGVRATKEAA